MIVITIAVSGEAGDFSEFNAQPLKEFERSQNYRLRRFSLVPGGRFCLYRTPSRYGSGDTLHSPCETPRANAHDGL